MLVRMNEKNRTRKGRSNLWINEFVDAKLRGEFQKFCCLDRVLCKASISQLWILRSCFQLLHQRNLSFLLSWLLGVVFGDYQLLWTATICQWKKKALPC